MNRTGDPNRRRRGGFPRERAARRHAMGIGLLLTLAVFAALAGCQPREHSPTSVGSLLAPERQAAEYRHIVLTNQLQVILVSDPKADRAAASMSVGVGSLADPPEHAGMAHFLEHMLFLGTQKYPQPGSYQQFIAKNAGQTNAFTADEQTTFFFEIAGDVLPEGLDRFSQFFIAPTFDQAYAARELNAVDSEHAKNVESDSWRVRQVVRDLYEPGHPLRKFGTGNRETLKGVGREELQAFYRSQYSSNRMTLAVVGRAGLDVLEKEVRDHFSAVENRNLPTPHAPAKYLKREPDLRLVTVEPVADVRRLTIEFPLPSVQPYYRAKPLALIASVLGHEGEGSLLTILKDDDLATSLSAGEGEGGRDFSSFEITVGLTPKGLERYPEVLQKISGTVRALRERGVPRRFFEEYRRMAELSFQFRERMGSARMAEQMSSAMQHVPMSELPDALYLVTEFDPALIRSLLGQMTPDNMLVTLVAKGVPADRTERYYRARYGVETRTGDAYASLTQAPVDARWHLPAPNPFIPSDVTVQTPRGPLRVSDTTFHWLKADGVPPAVLDKLLPFLGVSFTSGEALVAQAKAVLTEEEQLRYLPLVLKDALGLPVRLVDDSEARVWYLPDWRFRQPKADVVLKFFVAGSYRSARDVVLAQLYEQGLEESLNEFGYPVREAGLDFGIDTAKSGMVLSLSGYSPRMPALLDRLLSRLRMVDLPAERFAAVKDRYRRGLENRRFAQPYEQSQYFIEQLLETPSVPDEALLAALPRVTLADVQAYAAGLYRKVYIQGVVTGNLTAEQARELVQHVRDRLGSAPLPAAERVRERPRMLPAGSNYMFSDRLDVNNSLADVYFQAGLTGPRLRGALQIIARPLNESYYFNVRTQQQLGYAVFAGMGQTEKMLYLYLLVQSGAYPADLLLERTEAFVPQFVSEFKRLPPEVFEKYRAAVIQAKLQRDHAPSETARRLFYTAFRNDENWDYLSEEIRSVEALRQPDVQAILMRTLEERGRRRLVIRLIGKGHAAKPARGQAITLPSTLPAAG